MVRFETRRYVKMRLRPGLPHGLHCGSLQRSPDPVAGFGGGEGRRGIERSEDGKGNGRGKKGRGRKGRREEGE